MYNPLTPINNENLVYWSNPTKGEIRFGEGAIHYAEFTPEEFINQKTGKPKKWIKGDNRRWNLPR